MSLSGKLVVTGHPIDFVLAFLGGIMISFTPCVYPLLPVTAGYIGINIKGPILKGLLLSFFYVSGIAVTYSALGIIAALTGKLFGSISTHPVTLIIAGIIIIIFGLSMLKVFVLYFPAIVKLSHFHKKGYFSVFLLGLTSGLTISPCVSPVLGGILSYLVTTKNVWYGAGLLLAFGYGMGVTLIILGAFSSILLHLPKSGKWMLIIERICAILVMGVGCYLIFTGIRSF